MILIRFVIFLALAGAGIWYFLAEPDRRAERAAIVQAVEAEADLRQANLTAATDRLGQAMALIARSAAVARLTQAPPAPPQPAPARGADTDGGLAPAPEPAPQPAPTADADRRKQALADLPALAEQAGIAALRIRPRGAEQTLPPRPAPDPAAGNERWQAAQQAGFDGQAAQVLLPAGGNGAPRIGLIAPVPQAEEPAIVMAEAGLDDGTAAWGNSPFRLSLTGPEGAVLLANGTAAGDEAIAVTRAVPALEAELRVAAAGPVPVGPWALRSGGALTIAILVLLLLELSLSRRRLQSRLATAYVDRAAADMHEAGAAEAAAPPAPDPRKDPENVALLAKLSDSIGQEIGRPLAAIRAHAGAASRLVAKGQLDAAQDDLRQVSLLTDRITRILTNMRGYMTAQPYEIAPVSLRPVVQAAAVNLLERDPALGDCFYLELDEAVPDPAFVRADQTRLAQVLDSLLASSWEACRDQTRPELVISYQQRDDDLVISIDHSGGPVPAGDGDPPARNGTAGGTGRKGISFALAKSVVEGMNGALIRKDSALGGDRIELVLPKFRTTPI